jgi:hypothetical protein
VRKWAAAIVFGGLAAVVILFVLDILRGTP